MRPDHAYDPSERAEPASRRESPVPAAPGTPAWSHDEQCRIAWCRVHGDRTPRATVARELGVSDLTLGAMLDRGRVLSTSPLIAGRPAPARRADVDAADKASDQRREQFRDQMRRARAEASS